MDVIVVLYGCDVLSITYVIVVHSERTLQPKTNFSLWDNKVDLILSYKANILN